MQVIATRRQCKYTRVFTMSDDQKTVNRNCIFVRLLLLTFEKRIGMKLRLHTKAPEESNRVFQYDFVGGMLR